MKEGPEALGCLEHLSVLLGERDTARAEYLLAYFGSLAGLARASFSHLCRQALRLLSALRLASEVAIDNVVAKMENTESPEVSGWFSRRRNHRVGYTGLSSSTYKRRQNRRRIPTRRGYHHIDTAARGLAFGENYFLQAKGQIVPAKDASGGGLGLIKTGQKK
jgi:hypothetical protein